MMKQIMNMKGITEIPAALEQTLAHAIDEYAREGAFLLEEAYIRHVIEKTQAFPRIGAELLAAAAALREDAPAAAVDPETGEIKPQ